MIMFKAITLQMLAIVLHVGLWTDVSEKNVESWEHLDTLLYGPAASSRSVDEAEGTLAFRELKDRASTRFLVEMVEQDHKPGIHYTGLTLLYRRNPAEATRTAFRLLLHKGTAGDVGLASLPGDIVSKMNDSGLVDAVFSNLETIPANLWRNCSWALACVDNNVVISWFERTAHRPSRCCASMDAAIINRVCAALWEKGRPIGTVLEARCQSLREIPGSPRLTYLTWATFPDGLPGPLVASVLADESLEIADLATFIGMKRDQIKRAVDIEHLETSADRRKMLVAALAPRKR